MSKDCDHDYVPAYWRAAEPSYKRCTLCGDVKTGTAEEQKEWAENSPWKLPNHVSWMAAQGYYPDGTPRRGT